MTAVGDARKRQAEREGHYTHPDPAVRALIAKAQAEALREAATDPTLRLSGHSGISITRLLDRADEIEAQR